MSRRNRNHLDFRTVESAGGEVFALPPHTFTITALNGVSVEGDLNHLPWGEAPGLVAAVARAVEREAKRRRSVDGPQAIALKSILRSGAAVLVETCIVSGVTRPEDITPAVIDAVQRSLHTAYKPRTVQGAMVTQAALLRAMGMERKGEMAVRLCTPYSPAVAGGVLPRNTPREPYSRGETSQILKHLRESFRQSYRRLTAEASALLNDARDPQLDPDSKTHGWRSAAGIAWEFACNGPLDRVEIARRSGRSDAWLFNRANGLGRLSAHLQALFPTEADLYPPYLLFCALTGIEARAAANLTIADIRDGVAIYLKPRGRKSAEVRGLGPQARRLVQQVIEMTARAREFASAEHRQALWLVVKASKISAGICRPEFINRERHTIEHNLLDESGEPLVIVPARLRTTHINAKKRTDPHPDPSHTAAVDLRNYTLTQANAPLLDEVAERGIQAAQLAARPTVIPQDDAAAMRHVLPPASADTRVGACSDPLASPFTRQGTVCGADPWMCFRCTNSKIGERHLPNLLAWRRWLEAEQEHMPDGEWDAQWGETHLILTHEILPEFSVAQVVQAELQAMKIDPTLWLPLRAVVDRFTSYQGGP